MRLLSEGVAWLRSKTDDRWNVSVTCSCGGFMIPTPLKNIMEAKEKELGEPPEDLEWGYMKD